MRLALKPRSGRTCTEAFFREALLFYPINVSAPSLSLFSSRAKSKGPLPLVEGLHLYAYLRLV